MCVVFDHLSAPAVVDAPNWANQLEAWSTLVAAAATIWLLFHHMSETRKARADAHEERAAAAEDRELAQQDRRDQTATQAKAVVAGNLLIETVEGESNSSVRAQVWNHSAEPILNLTAVLNDAVDGRRRLTHLALVAPQTKVTFSIWLPTSVELTASSACSRRSTSPTREVAGGAGVLAAGPNQRR
jgi:hypothetical protein